MPLCAVISRTADAAGGHCAGLGYGLPVARLYARYFHGDLELKTIAGFGTDVYIRLRRLRKVRGSDIAI